MNKIIKKTIGFSLLELVIVIAIVGIMVLIASPMFRESQNKVILEGAQASLIGSLEEARSRALTGVGENVDEIHGIYIDYSTNEIYSCKGTVADWPSNGCLPVMLEENISLIKENAADPDIKIIEFERLSGKTSQETVTLRNDLTGEEIETEIDENGFIEI